MERFGKDGRLIIPLINRQKSLKETSEDKVRYVATEAYCPNGCSIIDKTHPINGYPGLRIRFRRPDMEGEFVISAIEGDFDKIILSGELEDGTPVAIEPIHPCGTCAPCVEGDYQVCHRGNEMIYGIGRDGVMSRPPSERWVEP